MGAFKMVLVASLLGGCASQKALTPTDRMNFLDKEIESSFTVRKILNPSAKKTSSLKVGQWVSWSTHYKGKSQAPHYSTLRLIKLKKDRATFEVETHLAGHDRPHRFIYQLKGFPLQQSLGPDRKEYEKLLQKIFFEKITVQTGSEKAVEMLPSRVKSIDEHAHNLVFEGVRTSKMIAEKCETEFIQSSRCWAYDYEIDRIKFRSKGRVWVHSAIPIFGVVRAEDEQSITRVIQFGENRK